MLGTYFLIESNDWLYKFERNIAKELNRRSFFCRFDRSDIIKFLPKMKVKQHKKETIIFPENYVIILLSGLVETVMFDNNSRLSSLIGRYQPGDILGYAEIDRGITAHSESWSTCLSDVEAIWMKPSDFK